MDHTLPKVEHKICFRCDYEADTSENICPRCGKMLKSSRNLRVRGGILFGLGAFLIVFMGAIAAFVGYPLFNGTIQIQRSQYIHTSFEFVLIFGVFGFVILFGLVALINGIYQLKTGRRSLFLKWLMLGLVFVLIFGGTLVSFILR